MLPGAVGATDDDGEDGAPELIGEVEGAGLEREFDAEDGALREEQEAVASIDRLAGTSVEGAGGVDRAFGVDEKVSPAGELAAEEREGG